MECVKVQFAPPAQPDRARQELERAVRSVNRLALWSELYADFFASAEPPAPEPAPGQSLQVVESPFFCVLLCGAFPPGLLDAVRDAAHPLPLSFAPLTQSDAETLYRGALDTSGVLSEQAAAYGHFALLLSDTGRKSEAETLFRKALEMYRRPGADMGAAWTRYALARLLHETGRLKEAETLYCGAMDSYREQARRNRDVQPALARTCRSLGQCLRDAGRPDAAEWFFRNALDLYRKANGTAYAPRIAETCGELAGLLKAAGRVAEAAALYRVALDTYIKLVQDDPAAWEPELAFLYENLAAFEAERSPDAGRALLQAAYLLYQKYPDLSAQAKRVQEQLYRTSE